MEARPVKYLARWRVTVFENGAAKETYARQMVVFSGAASDEEGLARFRNYFGSRSDPYEGVPGVTGPFLYRSTLDERGKASSVRIA